MIILYHKWFFLPFYFNFNFKLISVYFYKENEMDGDEQPALIVENLVFLGLRDASTVVTGLWSDLCPTKERNNSLTSSSSRLRGKYKLHCSR